MHSRYSQRSPLLFALLTLLYLTLAHLLLMTGCDPETPSRTSDPLVDALIELDRGVINDDQDRSLLAPSDLNPPSDLEMPLQEMSVVDSGPPPLRPRFELSGTSFYDTPWPSNARLTPRGTPDLSSFPTEHPPFLKVIDEIEKSVQGFATMPVIYAGFADSLSGITLPTAQESLNRDASIQLIALGDQCGARIPIQVKVREQGDRYIPSDTLQIKSEIGALLHSQQPYGLIILKSFGANQERPVTPPPTFLEVWERAEELRGETSEGELSALDAWATSLIPLRDCLARIELTSEEIALATVFTPQDPVRSLRAMRDLVMDPERVETRPPRVMERDVAWSRRRLRLTTYSGLIPFPLFQQGEPPYLNEGGGLVFEEDDPLRPLIQRWEDVPFAVTWRDFSEDQPFEGPRPVLVFIDGTGWSPWTHLYSRWLSETLSAGFVVFSFMPQFHGERAEFMGGPEVPTFNFFNPASGRMNFQQQAVEISFFLRVIREQLSSQPQFPPLDVSKIVYGGHSQGAVTGALNAAVESGYAGYVFNGLSSYLTLTILERKDLLDFERVVRNLLGNEGPLDLFSPALQMMQLGSESVDPQNFARLWRGTPFQPEGNHVFVINGFRDETTTPEGMAHLTRSASLPPFDAPGWEIDPLDLGTPPELQLPTAGNEEALSGSPLTIATYLDAQAGHATVYQNPILRQMTIRFWETALSEGTPRLEPESELMCDDQADGDQDGAVDCDDSDCASREPCMEKSCDDGEDNDRDGAIDCDDPDCEEASVCLEVICDDGLDNDENGFSDCEDTHCLNREPCIETRCRDREDGDFDGLIDCDDPDCADQPRCQETSCSDELDNDGDDLIDCEDPECQGSLACPELSCEDGIDDEGDGRADCEDVRCYLDEVCKPPYEERCDDLIDDDGDELVDCADPDCALSPICEPMTCVHGDLGVRVGLALFQGTLEEASDTWPPGDCTALGSGKDAPDVALRWTAPTSGVYLISTLGSEADTVLTLFSGDCDTLTELACHDDQPDVSSSAIQLQINEGSSVIFVISVFNVEDVGNIVLHIEPMAD